MGSVNGGSSGRGRRLSSGTAAKSTLLLTEYLAFVLDHRKHQDVQLAADAFGKRRRFRARSFPVGPFLKIKSDWM